MNQDDKFFIKEAQKVDGVSIESARALQDPDPNKSGSIALDHALVIPFPSFDIFHTVRQEKIFLIVSWQPLPS